MFLFFRVLWYHWPSALIMVVTKWPAGTAPPSELLATHLPPASSESLYIVLLTFLYLTIWSSEGFLVCPWLKVIECFNQLLCGSSLPRWSLWSRLHLPMQETQEMWVPSLGQKDHLEEEMATCSSTLAWKSPWTGEPGGIQSMGSRKSQAPLKWMRMHRVKQCCKVAKSVGITYVLWHFLVAP